MTDYILPVRERHHNSAKHREELARAINMGNWDLAVSRGLIEGVKAVNKFGRCLDNVDTGVRTDLWNGANAASGVVIWVAPTQARVHAIVSTSGSDASGGVGAYSVEVYGLTDWDTAEVMESVTLNGVTPVNTTNSYVIIHRVKCVFGANSTGGNVGKITATAATDSTVTCAIEAAQGQTQMAIYGFPSTQTFYMNSAYGAVNRANAGSANITVAYNACPDLALKAFRRLNTFAAHSTGETLSTREFTPPLKLPGPGIIKIQASGSTVNMDVSGGFDGYLITN